MRILFVSTDLVPVPPMAYGGIERVVAEVAGGIAAAGHECSLLAVAGSRLPRVQCLAWRDVAIVPRSVSYGLQVAAAARRNQVDFVHSFGESKWIVPHALLGGRAILSYGVLPQPRIRHLVARCGDQLLLAGCSNYITEAGRTLVGGHWRTGYNCVDVAKYTPVFEVAPDAPLVFLSRIDPIKGTHLAIELAEKAGRRLVIAGNHVEDGESGVYWREQVKPRINGTTVQYVGPVNDAQKNALLGSAAALLVPIQWDEPFGLVFVEALACGTPVIAFARGSLPELIEPGIEGFIGKTTDDLLNGLARLHELDRRACRRRVEQLFSTERAVSRYLTLYDELLGRPS